MTYRALVDQRMEGWRSAFFIVKGSYWEAESYEALLSEASIRQEWFVREQAPKGVKIYRVSCDDPQKPGPRLANLGFAPPRIVEERRPARYKPGVKVFKCDGSTRDWYLRNRPLSLPVHRHAHNAKIEELDSPEHEELLEASKNQPLIELPEPPVPIRPADQRDFEHLASMDIPPRGCRGPRCGRDPKYWKRYLNCEQGVL